MPDDKTARLGLLETVSKYRPQIMGFAAIWIFIFHVRDEALLFFDVPGLKTTSVFVALTFFCSCPDGDFIMLSKSITSANFIRGVTGD